MFKHLLFLIMFLSSTCLAFANDENRIVYASYLDNDSIKLVMELRELRITENYLNIFKKAIDAKKDAQTTADILIETYRTQDMQFANSVVADILFVMLNQIYSELDKNNIKDVQKLADSYFNLWYLYRSPVSGIPDIGVEVADILMNNILPLMDSNKEMQQQYALQNQAMYRGILIFRINTNPVPYGYHSPSKSIETSKHCITSGLYILDRYYTDLHTDIKLDLYQDYIKHLYVLTIYSIKQGFTSKNDLNEYKNTALALDNKVKSANFDTKKHKSVNAQKLALRDVGLYAWLNGVNDTVINVIHKNPKTNVDGFNYTYQEIAYNLLERFIMTTNGESEAKAFAKKYKKEYSYIPDKEIEWFLK